MGSRKIRHLGDVAPRANGRPFAHHHTERRIMKSQALVAAAGMIAHGAQAQPGPNQGSSREATTSSARATIVLVHGGFVDGSGWQGTYNILRKQGYSGRIVQNPTTALPAE